MKGRRPIVIAHRGASGHAPENTLPAFERAARLGAPWIELDVQKSRDGELFVLHDETVNRTTDGTGLISGLSAAEIKKLDAGKWFDARFAGTRIPTLEEALARIRALDMGVVVEIKAENAARGAAELIQSLDFGRKAMISSFNLKELRRARSASADVRIGCISAMGYNRRIVRDELKADSIHWWIGPTLTRGAIGRAHRDGLDVFAWTANTEAQIRRAFRRGADAIFTNYPDRAVAIAGEMFGASPGKESK